MLKVSEEERGRDKVGGMERERERETERERRQKGGRESERDRGVDTVIRTETDIERERERVGERGYDIQVHKQMPSVPKVLFTCTGETL